MKTLALSLLICFIASIYHALDQSIKVEELEQRIKADSILIDSLKHK